MPNIHLVDPTHQVAPPLQKEDGLHAAPQACSMTCLEFSFDAPHPPPFVAAEKSNQNSVMWNGRELEQKVSNALDCIGKGAAALSEAGAHP